MTLTTFKIIATLIILLMTIFGGLWPFLQKTIAANGKSELDFPLSESLASGIFLGAGLLHLLPNAAHDFMRAGYHYPYPFLLASISFLLLLLLEHISNSLQRPSTHLYAHIALLTTLMLSVHSLLEGAAVGIATDFASGFIIFIAIIAHKGAASFALAVNLNRSHLRFSHRVLAFSIFALMTPIGILGGDWLLFTNHHHSLVPAIFDSLAAGTFLYIATLHGLGRSSLIRHCCNMKEFSIMSLGFTLMAVVAIWT